MAPTTQLVTFSPLDTRLHYQSGAPAEVNKIAQRVEEKQGYGGYFDLHTGPGGFGFKASLETLVYYWGVYGVPKNDIERARRGLEVPGPATTDQDYYKRSVTCAGIIVPHSDVDV